MNGDAKHSGLARVGQLAFAGLSSFALSVALLLYLLALTWRGTLEQVDMSLHDVQAKYFNEYFWQTHLFGQIPIWLPGANLVLTLLAVNIICGGLVRIRKKTATAGVIICHVGVLWLLSAGLVEFHYKDSGYLTLYPEQEDDHFVSFFDWEIAVGEPLPGGKIKEHLIPGSRFQGLGPRESARFHSLDLPFDVVVRRFYPNSQPVPAQSGASLDQVVDGFVLRRLRPMQQAENNLAGAYIEIVGESGKSQPGILWSRFRGLPLTVQAAGKDWTIDLRHKRYKMPFTIRLRKFTKIDYPGTNRPKVFSSDVTQLDGDIKRDVKISMNEPLRDRGYTLFQTNWGPQQAPPGTRLYSQFEVVRNPTDVWPLASWIVITIGLLFHFGRKLFKYIIAQQKVRAAT